MFDKLVIANRGEIAVRILRACQELGIRTVAVYSEADRQALHVRLADEAYAIGPPPARDSYLRADRIIDVARASQAGAIHPGYGFLAENAGFAAACAEAGITFIGPPASAIAAMGDKVEARRRMQAAGVPVVPGTDVDLRDEEALVAAGRVGFPLFIKAAAGGGGKGLRLVERADELERALGAARREAQKAFGDDRVYLEKAVQGARHVEIQVLADAHGHTIHLGERECSIQRRHQKLVEEAPSPALDEELRRRMGQVAVQAAAAVGYQNAGTVEFLLDQDRSFHFLEMNTRLQVEHPVTEAITGIDIVAKQLRIAAGHPLHIRQEDVRLRGHAIECRITAEDPFNGFLPANGRIVRLHQPGGPGVRVDAGTQEGLEISTFYDSLLAKLITWGENREAAIRRMASALREYRIVGVATSIPFHRWLMGQEAFLRGQYDTSALEVWAADHAGASWLAEADREERRPLAALAAVLLSHEQQQRPRPGLEPCDDGDGGRGWRSAPSWKLAGRWEAMGR
ncbi:MAG: acetyl-CoA carboxylase biotin carboxylase subunit [Anaerolineae bacterium]|nr:acetyl-CoA carboxylase biotin carboxylase subunit [Anaerolineae bacterium]